MFCHKCGNQSVEGAGFCPKCGTQLVVGEATQQTPAEPVQTVAEPTYQQSVTDAGFKEFVDNHVRTTTKFKSAEDLIANSKPLTFMWWIMGVSLLGIFGGLVVFVTLFLGYIAAYFAGRIKYLQVWRKYVGNHTEKIDIEGLIKFLNTNLQYLSPHFKDWKYAGPDSFGLDIIESEFTKNIDTLITFGKNDNSYTISARKGKSVTFNVLTRTDAGFGRLACLYKTAPIISAAIKYYLKGIGE